MTPPSPDDDRIARAAPQDADPRPADPRPRPVDPPRPVALPRAQGGCLPSLPQLRKLLHEGM